MPSKGQPLGPRVRGDERLDLADDLRDAYEEGQTIRRISAEFHTSYGLTRTLLLEAGTELRSRGGPKGPRGPRRSKQVANA